MFSVMLNLHFTINMSWTIINFDSVILPVRLFYTFVRLIPTAIPLCTIKRSCTIIRYPRIKALFVLKIFKFLCWRFRHVEQTTWLEN